ncbi:Deleted in malignant brain tumors 1 protein [Holothuria leucospilota]|uniref:Deleted in malignant brain tumors 1 protein n=1 Tax=Holothuria leucospilota TaxID=206669 RepID=A0A9Q1BTC6_HOLLE|nr:Deleted in malignant brain tumors 1 protein [Holothuria leucospilota]
MELGWMKSLGLLVIAQLVSATAMVNDYTCISNRPLFLADNPVHLYSVGSGIPTLFNRYLATGNIQDLIAGHQTRISDDIANLEIPSSNGRHSDSRAGVFSCPSSVNGSSFNLLVINHRKSSKVVPKDYVTKTVSVGETASLDVDSKVENIKWRKKGVRVSQWNGLKTISITNVTPNDAGVYEAYTCTHSPHAYMRLIVKGCPRNRYGDSCNEFCTCYNGGICDEVGKCICPPGFIGDSCETVRSPNCFGVQCDYWCDDQAFALNHFEGTCGGNLFCLPDPYGCSCSPGYRGLGCADECEEGTFGADCRQTCHCASGSTCDNKMGICTPANCEDGWTGSNCNQKVACRHNPCQNGATCQEEVGSEEYWCECLLGFKGDKCEFVDETVCASSPCENGGTCTIVADGNYECHCKAGFEGTNCEIRACGGLFTDPTAIITSPYHPEFYPHNSHCVYVIQGGKDSVVRLNFSLFNLEEQKECIYDYVEVYDSETTAEGNELMGRFCGKKMPPIMTSKGNVMTVVFTSDESVDGDGFTAVYEVLESPPVDGEVRLVGGTSANEGRVEVYYNGQWGTVCDNDWDDNEATVICRNLGLSEYGHAVCCGGFGQGIDQIWLDEVDCTGSEESILDCGSPGWGVVKFCSHAEDAGVRCSP